MMDIAYLSLYYSYEPLKNFHGDLPTAPLAMFSFDELLVDYLAAIDELSGFYEELLEVRDDQEVRDFYQQQIDDLEKRMFEIRQLLGVEAYDESAN